MKHITQIDRIDGDIVYLRNNTKWKLSSVDISKISRWSKFAEIETEDFGTIDRGLKNLENSDFIKAEKI